MRALRRRIEQMNGKSERSVPNAAPGSPRRLTLGRRFRYARRAFSARLVRWCGAWLLRRLASTWRVEVLGAEHLEGVRAQRGGYFMSLWHGRMIVGLSHHSDLMGAKSEFYVLVSQSGDGNVSQALLQEFRFKVIRGSSSRGGANALRQMLEVLSRGAVLIITPDGPRGPRHSMNEGLAWMAKATGHPVVPCGFVCDRAWHARSWDRFTIPKPRARVAIVYGEPVAVARSANAAELEIASNLIRDQMIEAERRGFAHLGREIDW